MHAVGSAEDDSSTRPFASNYAAAELDLTNAMEEYKRTSGRMFPTWSEVLEVLVALGYEKPVIYPTQ